VGHGGDTRWLIKYLAWTEGCVGELDSAILRSGLSLTRAWKEGSVAVVRLASSVSTPLINSVGVTPRGTKDPSDLVDSRALIRP